MTKTKTPQPLDLVGTAEIAELLGKSQRVVYIWRQRGRLPEAEATVTRTPVWRRSTIVAWAIEHGYLQAEPAA